MGRALTAVGIALVVCFAILGTVVYVTRDEDGVAVDSILAEDLSRAVNDADRSKEPLALTDLTDFRWDRVLVFDARTPREQVTRALGFPWHGQLEFTAQSTDIFAFVRGKELVRFADYRGLGRFDGLRRPFQWLTPSQAVFTVRDTVARPVSPAG